MGVEVEVNGMVAERVHRRKEGLVCCQDLCRNLGMGAMRKERPQNFVCYKTGDKSEELNLWVVAKIAYLILWPTHRVSRECFLELSAEKR